MSRPGTVTLVTAGLTLVAGALACGGGKSAQTTTSATPTSTRPSPPSVTLDCNALAGRIHTCADDFAVAWAKTEEAARVGDPERFMMLFRQPHNRDGLGLPLCQDSWQTRDHRWKARLHACEALAECDTFSACAAPAIGDPLPLLLVQLFDLHLFEVFVLFQRVLRL